MEQLSWAPRAFLFRGLLTDEECDHLISLAKDHMEASTVVDDATGDSVPSTVRTSSGTFLDYRQTDIVARIERRLAHITMIPEENGESLQILHYVNGQQYEPHWDYFIDKSGKNADPAHGGQRVATVLMYLTTPEEGGETVFPESDTKVEGPEWSECAKKGLAVKSVRGDALLFYSLKPDGTPDRKSLHGSCPTTKGEKWSATRWIHVGVFNKRLLGDCVDEDPNCEAWAAADECDNNPKYMRRVCRRACGICKS